MNIKNGRYTIEITNPDKILFGKSGITKLEMVNYYHDMAPIMLRYCDDHPVSMQRFPNGIHEESFFQKNAGEYFPEWITRIPVKKESGGIVHHVVADKPATLVYLANQGCITPHMWLSKIDNLEKPDRLIFDLDPSGKKFSFGDVQYAAQELKKILDICGLPTFYMLTGSRGAHIIIPLKRVHTFEETRAFAHDVAALLAQQSPLFMTIEINKKKRGKRIFIDWLRNGFGATAVIPYAVRAHEGAPVAMPVTWKELISKNMHSQKYTIKNVKKRMNKVGDMWQGWQTHAVSLKKARKTLDKMIENENN